MADNFKGFNVGLESPGENHARPDFSSADATIPFTARYFKCSADGTLVVDMPGSTQTTIQVFKGYNVERITKIYNSGSTAITVDCFE